MLNELNTALRTFKNQSGEILAIYADDSCSCDSPMEWGTLFHYYTWQSGYYSMQENDFRSPEDWINYELESDDAFDKIQEKCLEKGKGVVEFANALCDALDKVGIIAKPILCYDHSDIKYYLGNHIDYWDGSVVGFVWQEKEVLRNEFKVKRLSKKCCEQAFSMVEARLETYTSWANGYVYGYRLFNKLGEEVDSCWGFIGSDYDELLSNIKSYVDTDDDKFIEFEPETLKQAV